MKKKIAFLLPLCVLLAAAVWAFAAGDAGDPLASLSYLNGTFSSLVDSRVDERLDASDQALLQGAEGGTLAAPDAAAWAETRLKQGDALSGVTGTNVMLLAGSAQVTYSSGTVVDATTGSVAASGSVLSARHRYIVAEDTSASFTVTSKTAVVDYQGSDSFAYSDAVDYNAMAAALKTLHLFKGSFTGYGEGFDLEAAPTRLQALIMFIRVLGEEEQALAWTGAMPFTDVARGSDAEKYVGYAYDMGYTNGYSATQFKPAGAVNAYQYTEFVLRAMGYSSAANTNLADTFDRALEAGVLTAGEVSMLRTDKFLRAELVYISYYALDAVLPDGSRTLGDLLCDKGVFTSWERADAGALVTSWRL
nr:S-layer homology domain-containing protein [uncultured Oscillibacter sp.]